MVDQFQLIDGLFDIKIVAPKWRAKATMPWLPTGVLGHVRGADALQHR